MKLFLIAIATIIITVQFSSANDRIIHKHKKSDDLPEIITFKASKGDVTFNHKLHLKKMAQEGCIPCHRTDNPKAGDIKTRFDERIAHYFCRGCHRDKGVGPTECHQCHNNK